MAREPKVAGPADIPAIPSFDPEPAELTAARQEAERWLAVAASGAERLDAAIESGDRDAIREAEDEIRLAPALARQAAIKAAKLASEHWRRQGAQLETVARQVAERREQLAADERAIQARRIALAGVEAEIAGRSALCAERASVAAVEAQRLAGTKPPKRDERPAPSKLVARLRGSRIVGVDTRPA